jgi:hypothetical protein
MTTATAPVPVMSGHCGIRRHQQCRGLYAGHPCPCDCHSEPEPEPEPAEITVHCFFRCPHVVRQPTPEAAHAVMELHYFEAHRDDIARQIGWITQ